MTPSIIPFDDPRRIPMHTGKRWSKRKIYRPNAVAMSTEMWLGHVAEVEAIAKRVAFDIAELHLTVVIARGD